MHQAEGQLSSNGAPAIAAIRANANLGFALRSQAALLASLVKALKGAGWSNLYAASPADRWAWFVCKILEFFKRKSPLGWSKAPVLWADVHLHGKGLRLGHLREHALHQGGIAIDAARPQ